MNEIKSDCPKCQWTNLFNGSKDGSQEATYYNHVRTMHPDHTHEFKAWKPFSWMKEAQVYCVHPDCLVSEHQYKRGW